MSWVASLVGPGPGREGAGAGGICIRPVAKSVVKHQSFHRDSGRFIRQGTRPPSGKNNFFRDGNQEGRAVEFLTVRDVQHQGSRSGGHSMLAMLAMMASEMAW